MLHTLAVRGISAVVLFTVMVGSLVLAQEGGNPEATPDAALIEQQNAEAARREFEEGFINRNTDAAVGEYVKENAIWCAGADPGHCTVLTNAFRKSWVESLFVAFPDLDLTIEQVVASGDTVFVELTGNGTFSHAFTEPMTGKTLSPTNKEETWSWLWIGTFEDGKVTRERWYWYWYNWPVKPPE